MKYLNMSRYYAILSDNEKFEISVNIDQNNNCYMPSLKLLENHKKIAYWDNDKYIEEKLIPWLKKERKDKDLKKIIKKDDRKILLKLFKQAIKDGVFSKNLKIS